MFIGTTRDGMATPVKLTKLCLICYGIFHLAVVICADTSSSLGTTTTTAQNPLTVASGHDQSQTTPGDASHVVSSFVVVAVGAIFGWFF